MYIYIIFLKVCALRWGGGGSACAPTGTRDIIKLYYRIIMYVYKMSAPAAGPPPRRLATPPAPSRPRRPRRPRRCPRRCRRRCAAGEGDSGVTYDGQMAVILVEWRSNSGQISVVK